MSNILIQVRRKRDGFYSKGKSPTPLGVAHFSKHGKAWTSKGAFHGHLTLIKSPQTYRPNGHCPLDVYSGCEVIIVDVLKKSVDVINFEEYYTRHRKEQAPARVTS